MHCLELPRIKRNEPLTHIIWVLKNIMVSEKKSHSQKIKYDSIYISLEMKKL